MISAPEDYGLTAEETLAMEVGDDPPEGFDTHWAAFRTEVSALGPRVRGTVDDGVSRLTIESTRSVRVVARYSPPPDSVRGVVVTTHGYGGVPDDFPTEEEPWSRGGDLATLRLRVRGYPPSVVDLGDLRDDWILHHVQSPEAWVLRGAVADLVQTVRVITELLPGRRIILHGESFGGGLAVIAAAQLAQLGIDVDRLVIALPSLGAWRWRATRYCNGCGHAVNELLASMREESDAMLETLRLHDAAFHASEVSCPVLCKLASRDDVVPAPSAAAVYNALASPVRWRFVTAYGHFDGGIADAGKHLLFERLAARFVVSDPATAFEAGEGPERS